MAGFAVSQIGDWLAGIALAVYVFEQTQSTVWLAAISVVRFVPVTVFGPLGGVVADRFERRLVMMIADAARAALMFALALSAAASQPAIVAIALAAVALLVSTASRPALSAMLPSLVAREDLAAANSLTSAIESCAVAVGPALGGILLALGGPSYAFAINGITFLISLLTLIAVRARSAPAHSGERSSVIAQLRRGSDAVMGSRAVKIVVIVVMASMFLYGQELVLLLPVAQDRLGIGLAGVSYLFASIGVGGIAGALAGPRLSTTTSSARLIAIGGLMSAAAVVGLALFTAPLAAYGVMTLDGAGAVIVDVLAVTTLQRVVPPDVLGRVFGILGSASVAGALLGSIVTPMLLRVLSLESTLIVAGAILATIVLVVLPRLKTAEALARRARTRLDGLVEALEQAPILTGASSDVLERIALGAERLAVGPGEVVLTEGEPAEDIYIIETGSLDVEVDGQVVNSLDERDYFGEIGLIAGVPRSATVRARTAATVVRIDGTAFLAAFGHVPEMRDVVLSGVRTRLARGARHATP